MMSLFTACEIRTANLSRRHHQLISEWESYLRRESLCLNDKCIDSDTRAAEKYYHETLRSLVLCSDRNERLDILHEFSTECMMDFSLKRICFSSREIFMKLFDSFDSLFIPPPAEEYALYRLENITTETPVRGSRSSTLHPQYHHMRIEYIEHEILSRLKLAHAIFKVSRFPPPRCRLFSVFSSPATPSTRALMSSLALLVP